MVNSTTPIVRQQGDQLITTSVDIAKHFGKRHQHIMEAIRNLDCSKEFARRNFAPIVYQDANNRQQPAYEITRDGFMFLCMGFTGHAAAVWKERYINAFNALERDANQTLALRAQVIKQNPVWQQIQHYKSMGLNHAEIGRLVGRATSTVRQTVRKMEQCGVLSPPANLAQLQHSAQHLLTEGAA